MAVRVLRPADSVANSARDITEGVGTTRDTMNPLFPALTIVDPTINIVACSGNVNETPVAPPPNPAINASVEYSINSGSTWTIIVNTGSGALATSASVSLVGSFDISLIRVAATVEVNDAGGPEDAGDGEAHVTNWQLEFQGPTGMMEG